MELIYALSFKGHENVNDKQFSHQYHSHSTENPDQCNSDPNGYQRNSIRNNKGESKFVQICHNPQRISSFPFPHVSVPPAISKRNGLAPKMIDLFPPYATVQARQRHHRESILPPVMGNFSGTDGEKNNGGIRIRRFASVQLRSHCKSSIPGRMK